MTYSAIEALTVIIVIQRFDPSVTCFNWESASETFGCKKFIPIRFTVCIAIFQEERGVSKEFTAVTTCEAFWMELLTDGIQTITLGDQKLPYNFI